MDLRKHYSTSIIRPHLSSRSCEQHTHSNGVYGSGFHGVRSGLGGGYGHALRMRVTLDGQTKGLVLSILAQTYVSRILEGET